MTYANLALGKFLGKMLFEGDDGDIFAAFFDGFLFALAESYLFAAHAHHDAEIDRGDEYGCSAS